MFQIIESVCSDPIRFLADTKVELTPGLVVQIVEINGTPHCTLSDGTRPFGIVDRMDKLGLVRVWFDTMIFRTDEFEQDEKYVGGNPLYVSSRGRLTTKKEMESSHLVGHVISGPDSRRHYLELNWI